MENIWAYIRIFEYLLVIVLCFGLLARKPRCFVFAGNILMAGFLMLNAINYVIGAPNTFSFQIAITLFAGIWAVTHLLDLLKKE
jgi:hypothetical protein